MPELEKALLADLDPDFGRLKSYRAAGHMAVHHTPPWLHFHSKFSIRLEVGTSDFELHKRGAPEQSTWLGRNAIRETRGLLRRL